MKNLVVLVVVSLLSISTVARADDSESGPSNNVVKLSAQRSEVKPENLKCITRGDFYLRIGGRVVLRDTLRGVDLFSSAFGSGYGDVHHNDVMSECLNTIAAARASQKFTPFTGEFFSSGSQTVGELALSSEMQLSCTSASTLLLLPFDLAEGIVMLKSKGKVLFAEPYSGDDRHGRDLSSAMSACENLIAKVTTKQAATVNFRGQSF